MKKDHRAEDDEVLRFTVRLSKAAQVVYTSLEHTPYFPKVRKVIELLDTVPEIGRVYDPDYPATLTPFEMRVVSAGRYALYYTIGENTQEVRVMFIEDQRRDPLNRLYGIYPHEAE